MRLILFSLLLLNSALSFSQQAEFKFKDKVHRLGKVQEGEVIRTEFSFINKGDSPLIISDYKVACACTTVEFPNKPILPQEEAVLTVIFDSDGKIGYQDRSINIISNANNSPFEIRITLTVQND
jgi:hypothetical protein